MIYNAPKAVQKIIDLFQANGFYVTKTSQGNLWAPCNFNILKDNNVIGSLSGGYSEEGFGVSCTLKNDFIKLTFFRRLKILLHYLPNYFSSTDFKSQFKPLFTNKIFFLPEWDDVCGGHTINCKENIIYDLYTYPHIFQSVITDFNSTDFYNHIKEYIENYNVMLFYLKKEKIEKRKEQFLEDFK